MMSTHSMGIPDFVQPRQQGGSAGAGVRLMLVAAFVRVSENMSCLLSAFRIGGLMWKRLAL
ncbi:hypothetical protein Hanom_Chr09g00774631 [Helianthus anomalus]